MRFETFVALRYLFSLRKQTFISVISFFAVGGVALGVAALIIVIGVMNGFSHDFQDKILGVNAHVVITSPGSTGMDDYDGLARQAETVLGVSGVTPFIYSEVMASSGPRVKGVALRGIDPDSAEKVLTIGKDMVEGGIAGLSGPSRIPGIVVGAQLARRLGVGLGSSVNLLSPTGRRSAAGFTPQVKSFRVVGVFKTGMYEYDSSLAYVTNEAARDLLGYPTDIVSGLEVRVNDVYQAGKVATLLRTALTERPVYVQSWDEMNANLFRALKLEKTAMFIILAMIVLVGSFSIVTTLVMLVMKKTRDIAVLMSIGADRGSIRRIFMLQGTLIGGIGTAIGYGIGIPVSLLLKKYQFIKLPSNVYPVDYLPVRLEAFDLVSIGLAAFLLCFVATIYPARHAAGLKPADALRYE